MGEAAEKLRAARELIARPGGWIQQYAALNSEGREVAAESSQACQWCMAGAIASVGGGKRCENLLRKATRSRSFWMWNDAKKRTQAEVVAAFDRAIALAEAEGA